MGYDDKLFAQRGALNLPDNMFRKYGLELKTRGPTVRIESGREIDGMWYVNLKRDSDGLELRAIMTPEQFFNMCSGGLVAMARWGFPQAAAIVKRWVAPR